MLPPRSRIQHRAASAPRRCTKTSKLRTQNVRAFILLLSSVSGLEVTFANFRHSTAFPLRVLVVTLCTQDDSVCVLTIYSPCDAAHPKIFAAIKDPKEIWDPEEVEETVEDDIDDGRLCPV